MQSELYKRTHNVDYLGNFPGADPLNDVVLAVLQEAVEIGSLPEPIRTEAAQALASDGSESLLVDSNDPLDVSGATVPVEHQGVIDVSSRDGRNLGEVDVTALPNADSNSWNGAALAADGTLTLSLSAIGADRLRGRVWSDNQYSVEIDVIDSAGNVIETITHADAVAGGTKTEIDLLAMAPQYDIRLIEGASAASTATGTVMLA